MEKLDFKRTPDNIGLVLATLPYYIVKDRDSGERDLATLVDNAQIEGCWVFTPHNDSWYNITYGTDSGTNERGVYFRAYFHIFDYTQLGPEVGHYHIHPKFGEEELLAYYLSVFLTEEKDRQVFEDFVKRWCAIQVSLPSSGDMENYVEIVKECPGCQLDFKIVAPYGLTTVTFSDPDELDSTAERYALLRKESPVKIALEEQSIDEAISSSINYINQQMEGLLTLEMDFREGL